MSFGFYGAICLCAFFAPGENDTIQTKRVPQSPKFDRGGHCFASEGPWSAPKAARSSKPRQKKTPGAPQERPKKFQNTMLNDVYKMLRSPGIGLASGGRGLGSLALGAFWSPGSRDLIFEPFSPRTLRLAFWPAAPLPLR